MRAMCLLYQVSTSQASDCWRFLPNNRDPFSRGWIIPHCFKQPLPKVWQLYLQLFIYDTCYPCRVSPSSILCASRNQFSPVKWLGRICGYPGHLLSGFVRIYFKCDFEAGPIQDSVLRRYESSQHCVSLPRR